MTTVSFSPRAVSIQAWSQDRFTIAHWIRQNKVPFYQQMKPLLDAYAAQFTRAVDAARSTRRLNRSVTTVRGSRAVRVRLQVELQVLDVRELNLLRLPSSPTEPEARTVGGSGPLL